MIEMQGLTKSFGEKLAVNGLNLNIADGSLFAFVGPNGAGKTTTIKMLVGLMRPTSGLCRVFGHDVTTHGREARALMSYIPDQPHIYEKLTGREFLELVGQMYSMESDRLSARLDEVLELFEITPFADDLVESYSHGMRQRCVMAAALLHEPRIIVVDEPMVGLDPKSIRRTKEIYLEYVKRGNIVFMSTHTLGTVEEMADRVGVILKGRLVAEGTVEEIRRHAGENARLEDGFLRITEGTPA